MITNWVRCIKKRHVTETSLYNTIFIFHGIFIFHSIFMEWLIIRQPLISFLFDLQQTWEPTLNPIGLQRIVHSPNKYLKAGIFFTSIVLNIIYHYVPYIPFLTKQGEHSRHIGRFFVEVMTLPRAKKCGPEACGWSNLTSFRSQGWQRLRLHCQDTLFPWNGDDLWILLMMSPNYPSEMLLDVSKLVEVMHPFASFSLIVFDVQTAHVVLREEKAPFFLFQDRFSVFSFHNTDRR